jgi:RNA polymerase subunit RPABC4/transcription elongation factor Spt4
MAEEKGCPYCAKMIQAESKICPHCGRNTQIQNMTSPSKTMWAILIIMLFIIVGALWTLSSIPPSASRTPPPARPSDEEIREFFAKCVNEYGESKFCRGETRMKYGISDKEVWSALGLR